MATAFSPQDIKATRSLRLEKVRPEEAKRLVKVTQLLNESIETLPVELPKRHPNSARGRSNSVAPDLATVALSPIAETGKATRELVTSKPKR